MSRQLMEFFHKQQLHKRVDQMGLGHQYFKPIKKEEKFVPVGMPNLHCGNPYIFWFFGFAIFGFSKWNATMEKKN